MIEHLQSHLLGLVHVIAAATAITLGTAVLFNFELYGRFGPFHWMVLASLATVIGGYWSARRRDTGWKLRHAYFMVGSYIGLLAAAAAEVASRVPGWPFGASVIASSAVVIVAGVWIMFRTVPRIAGRPHAGSRNQAPWRPRD